MGCILLCPTPTPLARVAKKYVAIGNWSWVIFWRFVTIKIPESDFFWGGNLDVEKKCKKSENELFVLFCFEGGGDGGLKFTTRVDQICIDV